MRLAYYPLEQLRKDITNIVSRYLDLKLYRLFFFGSRVSGGGDERSDIDIGIKGPQPVSFDTLFDIKEEIEALPLLYKIDFVDFGRAGEDFLSVVGDKVEPIYT